MNVLTLGRDALRGMAGSVEREWLVTNGIGGFASSSVSLMNTRRYHGLLFAALRPPVERVAHGIEARCHGALRRRADTRSLPMNSPTARSRRAASANLESFRLEGLIPVWTWLMGDARVEQRLWMRHGENTTYVQFTRIGGSQGAALDRSSRSAPTATTTGSCAASARFDVERDRRWRSRF